MSLSEKILDSEHDNTLPYIYRAKRPIIEGEEDFTSDWFADTLCVLCLNLQKLGEEPEFIQIYECFNDREVEIPKQAYMDARGQWLRKKELCHAHQRYGRVANENNCSFQDRDNRNIIF